MNFRRWGSVRELFHYLHLKEKLAVRILFLFILVAVNCSSSRQSPLFGSEKSRCNLVSTVSSSADMPQLSQFSFVYCNGGRRQHTHKRLVDIQGILTKHTPHGLFIAESLLDPKTERSLRHDGFNLETLNFKTKEKRIWGAVRNDTPYKRRSDLERKHIAAIWLEFGSGRNKFLVCGYYREHKILGIPNYRSNVPEQQKRFERFLNVVQKVALEEKREIHLIGDFNINYLYWRQNGCKDSWFLQPLVDDLYSKVIHGAGFVQTVSEITRWSKKINSILDLHFTNRPDRTGKVRLTRDFRTDHAVMIMTRKQFDFPGPPAIYKRCWKQVDWPWVYTEL